MNRYSELYENSVNPFASFGRDEKLQRYRNLNPADKALYNVMQLFMATKYTRLTLFVYMTSLHLLVFITLWSRVHS